MRQTYFRKFSVIIYYTIPDKSGETLKRNCTVKHTSYPPHTTLLTVMDLGDWGHNLTGLGNRGHSLTGLGDWGTA